MAAVCSGAGDRRKMGVPHMVIFPFMAKGHTIPLLHLAAHLRRRGVRVTLITTPGNHLFVSHWISSGVCEEGHQNLVSIIDISFPEDIPGIPKGIESTDELPSMSLWVPFLIATEKLQPAFEEALAKINSDVCCLISDLFLYWSARSASKFGIPTVGFSGMSCYATAVSYDSIIGGGLFLHDSDDEPFSLTAFPWIQLTRNIFDSPFNQRNPSGPHAEFIERSTVAWEECYGHVVNTFSELEPPFMEYFRNFIKDKFWAVGPLRVAQKGRDQKPKWILWLDEMLARKTPVLYISFGTQADVSENQLREFAVGLEESNLSFLRVVKKSDRGIVSGFEEVVKGRGMIVSEWVDQKEILEHESVQGFVSHCGWNSVLEGISAGVPILAWPIAAEQFLNAKMVVEEIKVGLRLGCSNGPSVRVFVTAGELRDAVVELMTGGKGKKVRERAKELARSAAKAVAEGGSSWTALETLIVDTQKQKEINLAKAAEIQ